MIDLVVQVHKIKGICPIYKVGDSFYILDGHKLKTDNQICMHSLSSIMPYYVALSRGILPKQLGLSEDNNAAFIQCLDPCGYTGGGTVVFKISMGDKKY